MIGAEWRSREGLSAKCLLIGVVAALLAIHPVLAQQTGNERWVGTWTTAPVGRPQSPPPVLAAAPPTAQTSQPQAAPPAPVPPIPAPFLHLNNQTLRQIVRVSIGGRRVRVVVSNAFGTVPLTVGGAHVALRAAGPAIVAGSIRPLMFSGQPTMAIPAGAVLVSDPVDVVVPPLADLAVDLYLPGTTNIPSPLTMHNGALQTSYVSDTGNHAGASSLPVVATTQSWFLLSRVEVAANDAVGAIVAFGDSITDGSRSTPDTNNRWPNHLAKRLQAQPSPMAVLNVGIGGNRVLTEGAPLQGVNALARFDRDVLTQPGATHVIVLEGINDIGNARENPTPSAQDIIAGHKQLVVRAHARGIKIIGATLTPFEGAAYFTTIGEAKRQAVNLWIRTSGAYDGVVDFDAATRDPAQSTRFLTQYDSGDHLHPSDAGYRAMADAIDLALFTSRPAATQQALARAWSVPRTPDGRPDLQGVWLNNSATPLERPKALEGKPSLTDEEVAQLKLRAAQIFSASADSDFAGGDDVFLAALAGTNRFRNPNATNSSYSMVPREFDSRTSLIVDPPDGRVPPLTAEAQRKRTAAAAAGQRPPAGPEDLSNMIRCITFGMPRLGGNAASYNSYYQIVQTASHVVLVGEVIHDARVIPLDGRPHLASDLRQWHGDSRGRWEGDTLVVETKNFSPKSNFMGSAEHLRLVERFTRVAADAINYEITVVDPTTWSRPWTAVVRLKQTEDQMYEYACHEGNHHVVGGILAGARAEEKIVR